MNLLVTKHPDVVAFARDKYSITEYTRTLSRAGVERLPENSRVFGNLPIPLISHILSTRPDVRYYHLIIPNVVTEGTGYNHLMESAYFQRFHVEEMEEYA